MANYLTHYTKKRQILAKKEQKLRQLVSKGAAEEKLILAAAEVRSARIRKLQAGLAMLPPKEDPATASRIANLEKDITKTTATPIESVLAEFRAV